jgi:hypothetical protein
VPSAGGGAAVSPSLPGGSGPRSDVLDALPDIVYLKTTTQSFNRLYYFAVLNGDVWVKPNVESTGVDGAWSKVVVPAALVGRVSEVSADDYGVVLFDRDGRLFWTMSGALGVPFAPAWTSNWGAPLASGPGFELPDGIQKWEYAVLTVQEDGYWVDRAGNQQRVGLGSVAHIWILQADRQRITFVDPILPSDLSYEMCGPLRGRFRSENLSASGSTTFVINRYGDMYTRLYDFDVSGADTLFFRYSYEDQKGQLVPAIQLPAPDWVVQPKIAGEITDRITVFKNGLGSDARVLRVEGRDSGGNTGFFEKPVAATGGADWVFHRTDLPIRGNALDNSPEDHSLTDLGPAEDVAYSRNLAAIGRLNPSLDVASDADWAGELVDFNLYCSPAVFRVHVGQDASVDLILHTVDSIRQTPRARGLDSSPYALQGTIEVPQRLLNDLASAPQKVRSFVSRYLGSRRFTPTSVSATSTGVTFGAPGWVFERKSAP